MIASRLHIAHESLKGRERNRKLKKKKKKNCKGAMKQGRGMCSTVQSFLVLLPNVPCQYYVHR